MTFAGRLFGEFAVELEDADTGDCAGVEGGIDEDGLRLNRLGIQAESLA